MATDQRQHPLVPTQFYNLHQLVLYLIHTKAYERAAEFAAGRSVLDWGCNHGYGLTILRQGGSRQIAGLDVSAAAIAAAQERLPECRDSLRVYDGSNVPFVAHSFELVTSFQVVEHIADCEQYLGQIKSVLQPGGVVFFTTPNRLLRLAPGMKPWNEFHVREFAPAELAELLQPWFPQVEILGLRGTPEIEQIYLQDCAAARRAASRGAIYRAARRLWQPCKRFLHGSPQLLASSQLQRFSTDQLHYSSQNLDEGLDLMAVAHA